MIIVEGGDNVGKSTAVKALLALDPTLRLLHRPRFKPSADQTIAGTYLRALLPFGASFEELRDHSHSVADRFLASECIYGAVLRGGCRMTPNEHLNILGLLDRFNARVLFCDVPDEVIAATWSQREQMYGLDDSLRIARTYREQISRIFFGLPVFRYNWTDPQAPGQLRVIASAHPSARRVPPSHFVST